MRYAYCHPTVMAGEMTHNARDTEARDNEGLQATLATIIDDIANNGTWEELPIRNGEAVRTVLFGSGVQNQKQLFQHIWIGGPAGTKINQIPMNNYKAVNYVLKKLGFDGDQNGLSTAPTQTHFNHFHIDLRPPQLVEIKSSSNLLTDSKVEISKDAMRDLIAESALTFKDEMGEIEMLFTMDMPIDDIHNQPVIVAQAKASANLKERKVGVCDAVPNMSYPRDTYEESPLGPIPTAGHYLWLYEFKADQKSEVEQSKIRNILMAMEQDAVVEVMKSPKHGVLSEVPHITYLQGEEGYFGKDRVVIVVKMGGYKITLNYIIKYINAPIGNAQEGESTYCDRYNPYHMWKLSETTDHLPPQTTFRDLTGAAVGETTGSGTNPTITLDTDAAGHGWYEGGMFSLGGLSLDANFSQTADDMSNWLPTSNPNEWVARAGTDAAGKMDMLSVLLHEYGHALGIEHSSDSHDYMATTLTPGMRRLPSVDEMQLMAQLAGEAREAILAGQGYILDVANNNTDSPTPSPNLPISMGFGISFLGFLRRNNSTSSIFANAAPAQYDIAANTTLTNGNFAGNNTNAWETTGKVNANNGTAVLSEVSTSQTRLNQVFVVGADDRYLSFTLSNIGLEGKYALTQASALSPTTLPQGEGLPSDAFEVALLNANTGASLATPIGLTRTDALLNIQANGAELKATGVTSVINADGSRTYVVDLAGIAVGTAVNLSFDLIGFGNTAANTGLPHSSAGTNSHVSVRDVRLTGAVITPQANDDMAMGLEDTVMQIIALANDLNIVQANASFSPVIVAAPMHGTVSINADGSVYLHSAHARLA